MLGLGRDHGIETVEVQDAVGAVLDPELDLPLSELGMVRTVRATRTGRVVVGVALTTPGCPMTDHLAREVTAAAMTVSGVTSVDLAFTVMPEEERRALAEHVLTKAPATSTPLATEVYAVASGKGGVGKSTVAANLAVALAQQGKRVGLLDADVWGYSVPQLFGTRRSPVALYETMLPVQAHGVRLMSLGFLVEEGTPIVWRGPMLHKALTQFVRDVHWGPLDVLLLDLPPGTGDVTLSVLELLPDACLLVVTTPQEAARTVARRVGVMGRDVKMPLAGVIENMSELVCPSCGHGSALFGRGGGEQLATELGVPLLGRIPLDMSLREAGDTGQPVMIGRPDSHSAQAIRGVAAALRPVRRPLAGRRLSITPV